MPLLSYHSALPLDLWNCVETLYNAMTGAFFYLTALLASSSVLPSGVGGIRGANAQYLLGLGQWCPLDIFEIAGTFSADTSLRHNYYRNWRYHRVNLLNKWVEYALTPAKSRCGNQYDGTY